MNIASRGATMAVDWEQRIDFHQLDHPIEIQEGMVFALETYCPASDGESAARIEEELVVTATGSRVITKFPAEELLVCGTNYVRGADLLEREESPL